MSRKDIVSDNKDTQNQSGNNESQQVKPLRLPDAELRRSLWVIMVSWGVFGSAWMTAVTGAPFASFARDLGANTFIFGVLSSVPFLAVLVQIPAAYIIERMGNRKRFFFLMHLPGRLSWLLIAALPWFLPNQSTNLKVGVFLLLLLCFRTLDSAGGVSWVPWVADIIPERTRARFLGQRHRLATLTALLTAIAVGWLLDQQPEGAFYMYSIIFSVAAIMGTIDILLYWKVPNLPMLQQKGLKLSEIIFRPLKDQRFRIYLIYAASSAAGGSVMGTFIWLYTLEVLNFTKFQSNLYLIGIASLSTVLTMKTIGTLADRFGNKPVLQITSSVLVVTPLLWAFTTPGNFIFPTIAGIIGGACGNANMMLGMNLMFSMTPRAARSAFIASLSLASGLAGFAAPVIAGAVLQKISHVQVNFVLWQFGNLHLLWFALATFRLIHVLVLVPRLPESKDISARDMLKDIVSKRIKRRR